MAARQEMLSLDQGLQATYASASHKLHLAVRSIIGTRGAKDFAGSIGLSPSHLSEALTGHGHKHFSLRWLPHLLHVDKEQLFLNAAADLVACRVVPKKPLTADQKLELLRAELRAGGADVEAIEERAYLRPGTFGEEDDR